MTIEAVREAAAPTRRPRPVSVAVPRPLLLLSAVAAATGVVVMVAGAWRTGVSWDETYHVLRLRNYLDHGWYLLDGDLLGSAPGPWEDQQYVYGPVTMLLLQGWSAIWGLHGVGDSASAFAVRHLGVCVVAIVGVASSAGLTRLLLGRWAWGLVTAALLLVLPVWTGHSMFNVKDVPVATGYTLVTLGVALLVVRARAASFAALLGGTALAVGTRPGIWPGLALTVAVAAAYLVHRRDWRGLAVAVGALAAAYGVLLAVYPVVFRTPVTAMIGAALESSRFDGTGGHWWYLPLFIVVEVPLGHLVLALTGSALLLRHLARTGVRPDARGVVALLVGLQCFTLPVLAVARQSNVYTGVRQMLFSAPAMAVLATLGLAALVALHRDSASTGVRRLVPVGIGLAVLVPLLAQVQLFPFSYAYSTVTANLASPAVERVSGYAVPTDYWRTSVRELAPRIPATGWVTCSPSSAGDGEVLRFSHESREDCGSDPVGPLAPYDDLRAGAGDDSPTSFLAVVTGGRDVPANCARVAEVTRVLYWRRVEMGHVAACDLVLPAYPDGGIDLDGGGRGGDSLMGGWDVHNARRGAGVRDGAAEVGFRLPDAATGRRITLMITALGAAGTSVAVNGVAVEVRTVDATTFEVDVPATTAAAYGGGRMVVALHGSLRLLTLAIAGDSR